MKVSTVAEMRALDRTAIERFGIEEELLMENAGQAAYFLLLTRVGIAGKRFVVLCGGGNNGGDGLVVARKIHSMGGQVTVYLLGDPAAYRGAAKLNLDILSRMPVEIHGGESLDSPGSVLAHCDVVIDAVFGTGLAREVTGRYRQVIEAVNASEKTVVSLDIPSGVSGDTGRIMGTAVRADFTVTFGLPKVGNMLEPGRDLCGAVFVSHISFPPSLYDADDISIELNHTPPLPVRPRDGHKGTFGQALFIAGAAGYLGAPGFAALSFLKAGGGYSRLAAPRSICPFIAVTNGEIVFVPQHETPSGSIAFENRDALLELSNRMDMVVMGPGLSLDRQTQELVRELAGAIAPPLLIDGDGITALKDHLHILRDRRGDTVLTPHMGELSRLLHTPVPDLEADRVAAVRRAAAESGATVVLKGAHSLIAYPDGGVFINMSGNPGMATAGSGDVLTGTVAAAFGMGLPLKEAVRKGVFLHGAAGDLAAEDTGEDGITARDILEYLPLAVKMDREGFDEPYRSRYAGPLVL